MIKTKHCGVQLGRYPCTRICSSSFCETMCKMMLTPINCNYNYYTTKQRKISFWADTIFYSSVVQIRISLMSKAGIWLVGAGPVHECVRRRPLSPKMELRRLSRVTVSDTNPSAPGLCIYSWERTFPKRQMCRITARPLISGVRTRPLTSNDGEYGP